MPLFLIFISQIGIDVIMVSVKVSRGIEPSISRIKVDSADTSQPPNGEICMDIYFKITQPGSNTVTPLYQ